MNRFNEPKIMTPSRALEAILSHKEEGSDEYTYIIMGKSPRTGKTWLYNKLLENGFKTFSISHHIYPYVQYMDDGNHYIVDNMSKQVVIILNAPLKADLDV